MQWLTKSFSLFCLFCGLVNSRPRRDRGICLGILNGQYQDRVRTVVPWIPHYTYPMPLVVITQGPISVPPQLQSFPICGTQNFNPCSTFIP